MYSTVVKNSDSTSYDDVRFSYTIGLNSSGLGDTASIPSRLERIAKFLSSNSIYILKSGTSSSYEMGVYAPMENNVSVDYDIRYSVGDAVAEIVFVAVIKNVTSLFDFSDVSELPLDISVIQPMYAPNEDGEVDYGDDQIIPWTAFGGASSQYPLEGYLEFYENSVRDLTDEDKHPWYDSTKPNKVGAIKLGAMPFRAYESIYNGFYRNILNNPFILDGVPEYNKYLYTDEGGLDTNVYKLHYRNWNPDFLTTALQSPQQGENPVLVGITTLPSGSHLTLKDNDGNSFTFVPQLNSDGTGISSVDVIDSPVDAPFASPRSIVDFSTSGISITDLRNCNALQRWLELNARKGLRFKDVVKGHFDVDIRFDELQMPEFIGGVSRDVSVYF